MNGSPFKAAALAHPNIAFIKYWGNRDDQLRLPLTGSLSMALNGLDTVTRVSFDSDLAADRFILNGMEQSSAALQRVASFLDHVRQLAGINLFARVESSNNYPSSAGIASSAAAFAALALAATKAAGLERRVCRVAAGQRRCGFLRHSDCAARALGPGGLDCGGRPQREGCRLERWA